MHCASTATLAEQVEPPAFTAALASGVKAVSDIARLPSFSMIWFCGVLTWFCHSSVLKNRVAEFA